MSYNEDLLKKQLRNIFPGCKLNNNQFNFYYRDSSIEHIIIPGSHRNDPDSWKVLRLQMKMIDIINYMQEPLSQMLESQPELLQQIKDAFCRYVNEQLLRHKVFNDCNGLYIQDTIEINEDGTVDEELLLKKLDRLFTATRRFKPKVA